MSAPVEVRVIPDGPILVRGADTILADDEAHTVTRPVVAVCACGKSSRRPWCDGTHKLGRKRDTAPDAPTETGEQIVPVTAR